MAVGSASIGGRRHAAVWTPGSFVDLHNGPHNGSSSAFATDGRWQGGDSGLNAVIWKGTPESMIVMDPPGFGGCVLLGMARRADGVGTQVGSGLTRDDFGNVRDHALLWHDTPESWIDMHPSFHPAKNSYMWGTTGDIHCGQSNGRAGLWFGDDPDSFYDLHQYIDPPPPGASRAIDIDIYDGKIYIAGRATYENGRTHAVVWIGTPENAPPPGSPAASSGAPKNAAPARTDR